MLTPVVKKIAGSVRYVMELEIVVESRFEILDIQRIVLAVRLESRRKYLFSDYCYAIYLGHCRQNGSVSTCPI